MTTEPSQTAVRVTIDEIQPDQDDIMIATLVSDDNDILAVPLSMLPAGARVGDVLTMSFQQDPDERELRRKHISDMQRRLFGSG